MRVTVPGKASLTARNSSGGVADVPVSHSAHRAQVVAGVTVLEDPAPHRGEAVEATGPATLGGLEQRRRVRGREMHREPHLPGVQRHGPARHVEEREHAHRAALPVRDEVGEAAQVAAPVGQDHALRAARAAAGEEDDVGVVLVEAPARSRRSPPRGPCPPPARPGASHSNPAASCASSTTVSRGRAYPITSAASSALSRALTGMNAAPSLASAPKIGIASSPVSPHQATRSPRLTPRAARARATWFDASSSSPKVSSSAPSVAARRPGTTRAPWRITSPTSRPIAPKRRPTRPRGSPGTDPSPRGPPIHPGSQVDNHCR